MKVVNAGANHLDAAVACLVDAFEADPQLAYFFEGAPEARTRQAREFFRILMETRFELGMPVQLLLKEGRVVGATMGYDVHRPKWLPGRTKQMAEFEATQSGLAERLARVDQIIADLEPSVPHYYLGVIGVSQSAQGRGVGGALLRSFLELSDQDQQSRGTFLETANPLNLEFYLRFGFKILGAVKLDAETSLWCLFRLKP